jgi:subtilase family serine protease
MLDVSMVSAACPHCKILVVEAASPSFGDLAASERTAGRLGAPVISDSYGAAESGFTQAYANSYHQPGHTVVASAGDAGFGPANFPANLASVTAVGGTRLARADNRRGWRETVWNTPDAQAGASGCSAWVPKPAWQHDAHCPMRTVADVAAVASGVPVYDQNAGGWLTVGGTSVAAPLIASIYGLAGNAAHIPPGYLYRHAASLFDVTAGGNVLRFGHQIVGNVCGGDYLCRAKPGYDAPTGLGPPDGIGAF